MNQAFEVTTRVTRQEMASIIDQAGKKMDTGPFKKRHAVLVLNLVEKLALNIKKNGCQKIARSFESLADLYSALCISSGSNDGWENEESAATGIRKIGKDFAEMKPVQVPSDRRAFDGIYEVRFLVTTEGSKKAVFSADVTWLSPTGAFTQSTLIIEDPADGEVPDPELAKFFNRSNLTALILPKLRPALEKCSPRTLHRILRTSRTHPDGLVDHLRISAKIKTTQGSLKILALAFVAILASVGLYHVAIGLVAQYFQRFAADVATIVVYDGLDTPKPTMCVFISWKDYKGDASFQVFRDGQFLKDVGHAKKYLDCAVEPKHTYRYNVLRKAFLIFDAAATLDCTVKTSDPSEEIRHYREKLHGLISARDAVNFAGNLITIGRGMAAHFKVQKYAKEQPTIVDISAPSPANTEPCRLRVDWGDGSDSEDLDCASLRHIYSREGAFAVVGREIDGDQLGPPAVFARVFVNP